MGYLFDVLSKILKLLAVCYLSMLLSVGYLVEILQYCDALCQNNGVNGNKDLRLKLQILY